MDQKMKILTLCRAGLVRSVALADVLKLHFEPTDVLPAGVDFNTKETLEMLYKWAEIIVIMEEHFMEKIPEEFRDKVLVCEVGADTYGSSKNPDLINKVWMWAELNQDLLGVKEHKKVL